MPRKDPRLETIPKSLNERILDRTIRHMLYLERLKTSSVNQILKEIDEGVIPDLIDELEKRLRRIEDFGFDRGPATTKRIEELIAGLSQITEGLGNYSAKMQGELFDLATDENLWQKGMIREELGIDIDMTLPAVETLEQVILNKPFDGRTLEQWFNRLDEATQERVAQAIRRGVVEGQTTPQIIRTLRGSRQFAFTDGVLNTTRAQTEAIVRSAIQHTSNAAREEMLKANSDILKGVQWRSTLDSRTCLTCAPLDGKVYALNKGPRPPIHVNCRCTIVGVLKSYKSLGIDSSKISERTRASANGQVPAELTYNDWLKGQPRDVVEEALGKSRAKLFIDGKLSVDSFTTNRRRELTLKEIRKREASAFKQAGL